MSPTVHCSSLLAAHALRGLRRRLLERSEKYNCAEAQLRLGQRCRERGDDAGQERWFRLAVKEREGSTTNLNAANHLAMLLSREDASHDRRQEAQRWWAVAVEGGFAPAQYALAGDIFNRMSVLGGSAAEQATAMYGPPPKNGGDSFGGLLGHRFAQSPLSFGATCWIPGV